MDRNVEEDGGHSHVNQTRPVVAQRQPHQERPSSLRKDWLPHLLGSTIHQASERVLLYVVGQLPPLHNRRRLCYRTDDSENAWHVLAWQTSTSAEWQQVDPFGNHFVLVQRLPLENWAEDQCEGKPFRRIPMTIEGNRTN